MLFVLGHIIPVQGETSYGFPIIAKTDLQCPEGEPAALISTKDIIDLAVLGLDSNLDAYVAFDHIS